MLGSLYWNYQRNKFRTSEHDTLTVWALHLPAALPPVQCKGGPKLRRKLLDRLDGQAAVRTGDDDFDGRFGITALLPTSPGRC